MRTLALVLALTGSLAASAAAQSFDLGYDQLYEPLIQGPALPGARATALGGAVTASVQDGSALWFNPAALARIPRIEISGDLIHNRMTGESLPLSLASPFIAPAVEMTQADLRRTRLGSAYITIPVPTYRGALTLAGGMTITHELDRVLSSKLTYAAGTYIDTLDAGPTADQIETIGFQDDQRGFVRAWQFGFGVDISPRVSVGAAAVYFNGQMDFASQTSTRGTRYEDTTFSTPIFTYDVMDDRTTRENMSGWGGHIGMLFRPRNNVSIGATIRSPVKLTIDSDILGSTLYEPDTLFADDQYDYLTTRRLQLPFSLAAGGAWLYRQLLVAVDVGYTDWSQTEYKDSPALTQYNDALSKSYRESMSIGGGVEWIIPRASTTLRAGARWAQLPFRADWIADERITLSAGAGFLIDQTMAIDLALAHETWRGGNPVFGFDERYATTRILATAAYRI